VREAILGRPFEGGSIRERLAALAEHPRPEPTDAGFDCIPLSAADRLVPSWRSVVTAVAREKRGLYLARHAPGIWNLPADRRASLPSAAAPELEAAAEVLGPPAVRRQRLAGPPERVEYLPELLWRSAPDAAVAAATEGAAMSGRQHDRHHFEVLFAAGPDPWGYETPYEQLKYRQTLSLLPAGRIGRALELACAEGRFTRLLAPRVEQLIAADFSRVALQRAAAACPADNVRFELLDLVRDDLPGGCDLIVCSEVLYFLENQATLRAVGEKLAAALAPGGHLLLAHANLQVDDPDLPGFDWDLPYGARVIGETLAHVSTLRLLRELRTEAYRIQLFQRPASASAAAVADPPPVVERATHHPPAPSVAARFRTGRGRPSWSHETAGRDTLPILMYHSIATEGPAATARYRVRPEQFDAQLRYLKEAGFSTVTAGQWLMAARHRRPLPGRPVLLTFDDGYQDFGEAAWPVLRRHGFGALVFLVTAQVGGVNAWDAVHGQPLRLMQWDQIRQLAAEGIEFGAHSASHRPLTGLGAEEVVLDALACRQAFSRELGRPATSFAYPYGDSDPVIEHLVAGCGFQAGFTCRSAHARFADPLMALPRIEISGDDDLTAFITKLGN